VPCIEPRDQGSGEGLSHLGTTKSRGLVIQEHVLEFLLSRNTFEEAENAIPMGVGNLLVHIIDTHVDQLHEIVLQLETQLDEVERDLDSGRSSSYLVRLVPLFSDCKGYLIQCTQICR
jgi:Mg2+ and Co2+ transporter CorA